MIETLYIEWRVITPSHEYNPKLKYTEIEVECEYEWEQTSETKAYISGGEVIEYDVDGGEVKTLVEIKKITPTQKEEISLNKKLVSCITDEIIMRYYPQ